MADSRVSPSYPVASTVVTAALILDTIAGRDQMRAQELAKELKLNRSTVHRMLHTLEVLGYVSKHDDGYYRLTFHLFEIGNSVLHSHNLMDPAHRSLLHLAHETGFTVNHAVLYEDRTLYIDKVSPQTYLHIDRAIGESEPLHCTSLGKVLLAFQPDSERTRILDSMELSALTPNTIVDRSRLEQELQLVRTRRYAVDNQELTMELRCVAAPVILPEERLVSAVSISGPSDRLLEKTIPTLLPQLEEAVETIAANMASEARGTFS
jgi:IclR family KDG regulon transcriptional repressor